VKKLRLLMLLLPLATLPTCAHAVDKALIADIQNGNAQTLQQLPTTIKRITSALNDEQSAELIEAIGFALLKNPVPTLRATDAMDKDDDLLVQRFGTGAACALPVEMNYTRNSTLLNYKLASESLIRAGAPALECLSIMQESMEEVKSEDDRGNMKWGVKIFTP